MGRIYLITNILTGDRYVGRTYKSLKERFSGHIGASRQNSKTHLHRAIRKYGKENFIIEEIEQCEENLGTREIYWISQIQPEYNQTLGGDGSELGYRHTEEQKEKWSKMRKGQPSPCGFSGKSHTQESKNKTSQSLKNNPNIKRIKVFQYDIEGNFLREFESIAEAAKFVGTNPSNIKYTCEGKFNHCKGYKWTYDSKKDASEESIITTKLEDLISELEGEESCEACTI